MHFADLLNEERQVSLPEAQLRPVMLRPVDLRPQEVGHIQIDRWIIGNGDGFDALGGVFNMPHPLLLLRLYLEASQDDYRQIYRDTEQHWLDDALECVANGQHMVDDVAQFMVDCLGVAMILCQDFGGDYFEVTLLIPRITRNHVVTSRCLIIQHGVWAVGEWSLPGFEGEVPLFGLPIAHPWWREHFRALDGHAGLVERFHTWGLWASHNVTR